MTTYIQSLTLPTFVFAQPAVAVLLPVALGTAVGFSTRRTCASAVLNPHTKAKRE